MLRPINYTEYRPDPLRRDASPVNGLPSLDELGPGVGEDKVLDAHLGVVKDTLVKLGGDVAPVPNVVSRAAFQAAGGVVERSSRIRSSAVAADDAGGILKKGLQALEVAGRQVDLELSAVAADEVNVDAEGSLVALARQSHRVGIRLLLGGRLSWHQVGGAPLADSSQESNVFARKVPQGRKLL